MIDAAAQAFVATMCAYGLAWLLGAVVICALTKTRPRDVLNGTER